ncbi:MAG TPA: DUF2341 domain-containing protein, partial [Candidatus Woesearchaeota archaeon]|nr:DUF2341 domain-containing protein [Candidatus Woesearchaeota archaeon]
MYVNINQRSDESRYLFMRVDSSKIDLMGIKTTFRFYLFLVFLVLFFVLNMSLVESISSGDLVVFISNTNHNGNFSNDVSISEIAYSCTGKTELALARCKVDNFCYNQRNSNLSLINIRALVSVSYTNSSDQLLNIPANFSLPSNKELYWYHPVNQNYTKFANNWSDMLDGSIMVSGEDGTGYSQLVWSGTKSDGTYKGYDDCDYGNCGGWTANSGGAAEGHWGYQNLTNGSWLDWNGRSGCDSSGGCGSAYAMRCVGIYSDASDPPYFDGFDDGVKGDQWTQTSTREGDSILENASAGGYIYPNIASYADSQVHWAKWIWDIRNFNILGTDFNISFNGSMNSQVTNTLGMLHVELLDSSGNTVCRINWDDSWASAASYAVLLADCYNESGVNTSAFHQRTSDEKTFVTTRFDLVMSNGSISFYKNGTQFGSTANLSSQTFSDVDMLMVGFGRYSNYAQSAISVYDVNLTITNISSQGSNFNPNYSTFDGSTTDFNSSYNETTIQSVSKPVLEKSSYGKIEWAGEVNASGTDFDSYVNISFNNVSVDTSNLDSSFNSSANITIYFVNMSNVIVLENEDVCTDCVIIENDGQNVTFNVSHFSDYSLQNYDYAKTITIDNTGNANTLTDYQIFVEPEIFNETGLVGSWHFDEGTGNYTVDSSGNHNTGTLYNSPTWTSSGRYGNAINFDGVNDYVSLSNLSSTTSITITGWFKADSLPTSGNFGGIFGTQGWATGNIHFQIYTNATGTFLGGGINGDDTMNLYSIQQITAGKWYQFALTKDAGQYRTLYINGTHDSNISTNSNSLNLTNLRIGNTYNASRFFNGTIDEVRIYNRSLNATEIEALYNQSKSNYDDVRFVDLDGSSVLNYWIENDGKFWVKVPSIPASSSKNITVYYGNQTATKYSSGDDTFIIFDDFDGTLGSTPNSSKWDVHKKGSASATVQLDGTGHVQLAGQSATISSGNILSKTNFTKPFLIRVLRKYDNDYYIDVSVGDGVLQDQDDGGQTKWWHTVQGNGYAWIQQDNDQHYVRRTPSGASQVTLTSDASTVLGFINVYEDVEYVYDQNANVEWYFNGSKKLNATNDTYQSGAKYLLLTQGEYTTGNGGNQYIDYVFVRNYSNPEPSITVTEFTEISGDIEISNCTNLNQAGKTYKLTGNITNSANVTCMNISANNITLDCQGYTIDGIDSNPSNGILINRSSSQNTSITITNCIVKDWNNGFLFINSSNNTIVNNHAESCPFYGFGTQYSNDNNFTNNTAYLNQFGFYLSLTSKNNFFKGNNASNSSEYGFMAMQSGSNTYEDNFAYGNAYAFYNSLSTYTIYKNNNITENTYGFYITENNNNLTNNTIESNEYGIYISTSGNNLTQNKILNSNVVGLFSNAMGGSSVNRIFNNFFNNTINVNLTSTIRENQWNTTNQSGERVDGESGNIGGNLWLNPSGTGHSQTCSDSNSDGFCDVNYTINSTGPNIDYLPLSFKTKSWTFQIQTNQSSQNFTFETTNANFTVDWGDGNESNITGTQIPSHMYDTAGVYNITLTGTASKVGFCAGIGHTTCQSGTTPKFLKDILTVIPSDFGLTSASRMFMRTNVSNFSTINFFDEASENITSMYMTFYGASAFNHDISGWNTSKVTDMKNMFYSASTFNQSIGSWDTNRVTTMETMFCYASAFNQDLNGWDVSNVTTMYSMFDHAYAFNGNISTWNTTKVKTMEKMFYYASDFNQNIGFWDTSNVTNMRRMFWYASAFNKDIGEWNTSKVSNMNEMFRDALAFDQDIGSWNISQVTTMSSMFLSANLSTPNYNSLLIGWANQSPNLQSSVIFHGGNSKYTSAALSARNTTLIGTHSWTITDGGKWSCTKNSDCEAGYFCNSSEDCQAKKSAGQTCNHTLLKVGNYTEANGVCQSGYCRDGYASYGDGDGLCEDSESCWCVETSTQCAISGTNISNNTYSSSTCYSEGSDTNPGERALCLEGAWTNSSCGYSAYNSCSGACQKGRDVYYCNNTINECYDGGTNQYTFLTTAGKVCSAGEEVAPSSGINCDTVINCTTGSCSANRYYLGCAAGSTSCTNTSRVAYSTWNATSNNVISETTYKSGTTCSMDSNYCGLSSASCTGSGTPYSCQITADRLRCDGSGSCTHDLGNNLVTNVTSGYVCSGGVEIAGNTTHYAFNATSDRCSSGDPAVGFGDRVYDVYACDGGNAQGPDVGDKTIDCDTGCCFDAGATTACIASGNHSTYNWYDFGIGDGVATDYCISSQVLDCYGDSDCAEGYECLGNSCEEIRPYWTFQIQTNQSSQNFTFETTNANFTVDWGDGNESNITGTQIPSHMYDTAGVYNITLTGTASKVGFCAGIGHTTCQSGTTPKFLKDILTVIPSDFGLTSASRMFMRTNVSNFSTINFFDEASENITSMYMTFYGASAFNHDISGWNTSKVTDMKNMFYSASTFNQSIGSWDTNRVTTMETMFCYASAFNQDLNGWDVSNVTTMYSMFDHAYAFNGNISTWNTTKVKTMEKMFYYASDFNQNIGFWDTSNVTNMRRMFWYASAFNKDIGEWNTSKVSNMNEMFRDALAFDQDIGSWNISQVTTMSSMFLSANLSTPNYNSLLIGWANQSPNLQSSVIFHGGNSKYTSAALSARNTTLIGTHSWTITDGGKWGCTKNSDCSAGLFCNSSSDCQAKLADGVTCVGATAVSNITEQDGACTSGYCDNDGVGSADDNWCFTPHSTYYDGQETTKC